MKIETLKERIKNTGEKIVKINGTIERHKKQLVKKAKVLTDKGIDLNNYDRRNRDVIDQETSWDIFEYESKLEDIKSNDKKLSEATDTLAKLVEQLKNQLAKESETENLIPEVLNIFLENWKQKCIIFYTELANEYITLVAKEYAEYEITLEELEKLKKEKYNHETRKYIVVNKYSEEETDNILSGSIGKYEKKEVQRNIRNRYIQEFKIKHFASDMIVLDKIINYETVNNVALNKILDEDVKRKKEQFINRIKEVIGEITDLSGLSISGKGEINGIAKGIKCNAKVETIGAGGHSVQCYHFRVLVNTIK